MPNKNYFKKEQKMSLIISLYEGLSQDPLTVGSAVTGDSAPWGEFRIEKQEDAFCILDVRAPR